MATKENNTPKEEEIKEGAAQNEENVESNAEQDTTAENESENAEESIADETAELNSKIESLEKELENSKKEYLFLMAEFDNFRKRTLKEKSEIIKNGAENAMRDLLPVVDDFERALQAINENNEIEGLKEGVVLIYNKFIKYLEKNGVKAIDSNNKDFDTELHEAVTTFPATDE